jgi:hypothetical protein
LISPAFGILLLARASHDFEAETPEEALALARKFNADEASELWFEHYAEMPVNEIAIEDANGDELALWHDDDLLLRLAADDLLAALEQAVQALNTAPLFRVPHLNTDSYKIAAVCDRAIAKAKGGAA